MSTHLGCLDSRDPFPAQLEGELEIFATYPVDGGHFDQNAGTIDICFSAPVAPDSLSARPAQLVSGQVGHELDVELQLFPWRRWLDPDASYDPAAYAMRDCPGSVLSVHPQEPLIAGLRYRLRIDDSPVGWNGERLNIWVDGWEQIGRLPTEEQPTASGRLEFAGIYTLSFFASAAPTEIPDDPPDTPQRLAELFAPGQVFSPELANCSCHQTGSGLAAERLDLSSPEAAALGLQDRVMANGEPMVAPGDPAGSYLVQKLASDPEGGSLRTVLGEPMPLEHEIHPAQRAQILLWIAEGALF